MSKPHYDHIRGNEQFHHLVSTRSRLGWTLAILIMAVYYSFILVIAFAPELFGRPVSAGGTMTWGILTGFGVILFTFAVTGIYVHQANTRFDALLKGVIDASHEHVNSTTGTDK